MNKKNIIGVTATCVGVASLHYMPFSLMFGSIQSFFSYANLVGPLASYFGGFAGLFLYTFLKLYFLKTTVLASLLINTLPGMCANLYWLMPFTMSVIIPLLSFVLFIVHPVGYFAFVYGLLWFIPVVIYGIKPKAFFFKALSATFAAHAVGSVVWLYAMPVMAPLSWIMLTPIALCERIVFAAGMTFVRSMVYALFSLINRSTANAKRWAM